LAEGDVDIAFDRSVLLEFRWFADVEEEILAVLQVLFEVVGSEFFDFLGGESGEGDCCENGKEESGQ
jgi:hypothetical protein